MEKIVAWFTILLTVSMLSTATADDKPLTVDKEKREVILACKVAPRKLPNLQDVYPVEVIATWPAPKGQKAHETVVTFENVKPSELHAALVELGLKPGRPTRDADRKPEGPEVAVLLEIPGDESKPRRVAIEEALVVKASGKAAPSLTWRFTGSVEREPDPEKDDKVYGADLTGTLIAIFPVTDDTVLQSELSTDDEKSLKLETNPKVLPKEGTPIKLILQPK
jgi:hypothetical protein